MTKQKKLCLLILGLLAVSLVAPLIKFPEIPTVKATTIFTDGEVGSTMEIASDFSAWTSSTGINVVTDWASEGSNSANFTINQYCRKTVSAVSLVYNRFYIHIESLGAEDYTRSDVGIMMTAAYAITAGCYIARSGGDATFRLYSTWNGSYIDSGITATAGNTYYIEIAFYGNAAGWSKMWVNETLTEADGDTSSVADTTMINLGNGDQGGISFVAQADSIVVADEPIGQLSGGESSNPVEPYADYDYTLGQNSTATYLYNTTDCVYSNADAMTAFNASNAYYSDHSVYINGTFTTTGNTNYCYLHNIDNANITFDPLSLVTIADSSGIVSAIKIQYCNNVTVTGIVVDGNSATQTSHYNSDGVFLYSNNNVTVDQATITDVRGYGFNCGDESTNVPSGISNSLITFCGWNGITFWGVDTAGYFAINNTVAYSSDVGISMPSNTGNLVKGNTIYCMNGTTGGGGNAGWGVGLEDNGAGTGAIVEDNIIYNCTIAICSANSIGGNLIQNNTITHVGVGITDANTDGYNVITKNTISNWGWDDAAAFINSGIAVYYSPVNDIISFNTLTTSNTSSSSGYAIFFYTGTNCSITNNTITMPLASTLDAVHLMVNSDTNLIQGNIVEAATGVHVNGATCNTNKINDNDLSACSTEISDTGTGTLTNPTSCATYTLYFCNPVNGTGAGTFVYSNTTTTYRTIEEGQVLNVNGENATAITGTTYEFEMNQDYFAYIMEGDAPEGTYYTLTMLAPVGSGSVNPVEGEHEYLENYNVTLIATVSEGYTFAAWELNGVNETTSSSTWYVVMDENHTAKAYFEVEAGATPTATPSSNLPSVDVSALWIYLYDGDFIGWFYALMLTAFTIETAGIAFVCLLFLVPLYLRTHSLLLLIIAWLLVGSFIISLIPAAAALGVFFIALGIAGVFYRLFRPANN